MSAQAAPFAVLTDIARRSRQLSGGLPEQKKTAAQWNGIGFKLAGEHYVAPMGEVIEILRVPRFTKIPGVRPFMLGAANVRGRLLPLVDLNAFFQLPHTTPNLRRRRVLVVEKDDIFSGLVVDSVLGMQYFDAENFTSDTGEVPDPVQLFIAGGYARNNEIWNVFSATKLLGDERFLDVAQR